MISILEHLLKDIKEKDPFNLMKYLIFDTETNGLPTSKNTTDGLWYKKFPYIVQISWIMYDSDKELMTDIQDYIIKIPNEVNISSKCTEIHGIDKEICRKKGTSIQFVISRFNIVLTECDMIIGHNIVFDINMIRAEYIRNGCLDPFKIKNIKPVYCTMKNSIDLCKIEAQNKYGKYYKWPKLIELHKHLFDNEPKNLHNSLTDIYVTLRCFYKMEHNIDLLEFCSEFRQNTKYIYE